MSFCFGTVKTKMNVRINESDVHESRKVYLKKLPEKSDLGCAVRYMATITMLGRERRGKYSFGNVGGTNGGR